MDIMDDVTAAKIYWSNFRGRDDAASGQGILLLIDAKNGRSLDHLACYYRRFFGTRPSWGSQGNKFSTTHTKGLMILNSHIITTL